MEILIFLKKKNKREKYLPLPERVSESFYFLHGKESNLPDMTERLGTELFIAIHRTQGAQVNDRFTCANMRITHSFSLYNPSFEII